MITEKPKLDAFCETVIAWRHEDGTETPITDAYHGPEEYSSVGPFFGHGFGWALYRGEGLKLLVRRWKTRSGSPRHRHRARVPLAHRLREHRPRPHLARAPPRVARRLRRLPLVTSPPPTTPPRCCSRPT